MAWDAWNYFVATGTTAQCEDVTNSTYNDQYFRAIADSFVSTGLRDAGYDTIMLVCGPEYRDSNGDLKPRPQKFSSSDGIKNLIAYIHSQGLKAEVYTDAGRGSCLNGGIGSWDYPQRDADTWATWGADAIKIDYCGGSQLGIDPKTIYATYRDAIARATASTGHPMWIEACDALGHTDVAWRWGPSVANFWRTEQDISANWNSVMTHLDSNQHPSSTGPGHFNFPDMLMVGLPGLTETEQRAHFSLWAVMASPLILAFDPRTMSDTTKAIVTAPEVLAVDQDALGRQGLLVSGSSEQQVYAKRLSDSAGARAVPWCCSIVDPLPPTSRSHRTSSG